MQDVHPQLVPIRTSYVNCRRHNPTEILINYLHSISIFPLLLRLIYNAGKLLHTSETNKIVGDEKATQFEENLS